jgi:hypothetical protein
MNIQKSLKDGNYRSMAIYLVYGQRTETLDYNDMLCLHYIQSSIVYIIHYKQLKVPQTGC